MAIIRVDFVREGAEVFVDIVQTKAEKKIVMIGEYSKVITEKTQRINITPYLMAMVERAGGGITTEMLDKSHIVDDVIESSAGILPYIYIDGMGYSADTSYLPYGENKPDWSVLSDLPYHLISPGQTDILCYKVELGDTLEVDDGDSVENDINVDFVHCFTRCRPTDTIISAYTNGLSRGDITYVFKPMGLNGVRLAWINRYGALDFWNFDHLREQSFGVSAETIYTHNGYLKLNPSAERLYTVETREVSREVLEVLSYIIASPKVWLVKDDGAGSPTFSDIDVVTEQCKTFSDAELLGLQIVYRPKKRVL